MFPSPRTDGADRSLARLMPAAHGLRLLAVAAGLALALAQWPALAQPGPLGDPTAQVAQADPSARIATLTDVQGNLSFAPAGSDDWAAAGLNRPITTGDRLWVDNGGRAELHAGSTAVRLGSATAASVLNLDDNATQVKLTQGTLQLRVRALPSDQSVEVDTPNLAFVPREPGDYRLDVAPDGSTTTVTMRHGRAVIYGDNRSLEMARGEQMSFAGTNLADAGQGNIPPGDAFDRWTAARDAREDASPSARYVPREMTGYAALDGYGDWQEDPGYGAVWFPTVVESGWAPYSTGHWAWIEPWGWTWVDDAPWGFAPFHYGRWAYIGSRWGWVPGPYVPRPCYAPALVAFVGASGPNWSVNIGGGPGVAWYPLGPHDVYRPVYHASPTYITQINRVTVNNVTINQRFRGDPHFNRDVPGAITGMPARNFVEGRPVPRDMHRAEWRNLPAGEARGAPPVAPVKSSLLGAAPVRQLPPQARQGFEREAIAARAPGRPAQDELARRFAREGGVVPGAGPAWRAGDVRSRRPDAPAVPAVRMSQAAMAAPGHMPQGPEGRGNRPAPNAAAPGVSTRPDQARGMMQMPDAQRQAQELQHQQQAGQRQQFDQQRLMQEQQRQQQEARGQSTRPDQARGMMQMPDAQHQQQAVQRQQMDQQRAAQEQQRAVQEQQRQQQTMQRQQMDQQRATQEQQRAVQEQQRQQQTMQRQQMDQQRATQEQQRAVQEQQRQQQTMQRQQMDQQRAAQEQQRAVQEQQRQQQAVQRQQMDQQRAAQEQQRAVQEQQRQQQAMQRQQMDQQRQAQDQQRAVQEQQRQQQAMQRQQMEQQRAAQEQQRAVQEQQRQQQAMQRQQMDQQRQAQEQQRAAQEQQRQQQAMQRQQMDQQRAAQEQQRAVQEQQRRQQDQQRQIQERQRQQQIDPQHQQHVPA